MPKRIIVDVPNAAFDDVITFLKRRGLKPIVKNLDSILRQIPRGNQVLYALQNPGGRISYSYYRGNFRGEEFALQRLDESVQIVEFKNGRFQLFSIGWETFKTRVSGQRRWVKGAIDELRGELSPNSILMVDTYEEAIAWFGWPWREAKWKDE